MLSKFAWNTFKNTGNIDAFLEYKQLQDIENVKKVGKNETSQNQGNSNSGKSNV